MDDQNDYGDCIDCGAKSHFRRDGLCINCLAARHRSLVRSCAMYIKAIDERQHAKPFDRDHDLRRRDQHMAEQQIRTAIGKAQQAEVGEDGVLTLSIEAFKVGTVLVFTEPQDDNVRCSHDPRTLAGQPIGMYHCPECGEIQIAGLPHTDQPQLPGRCTGWSLECTCTCERCRAGRCTPSKPHQDPS